MRTLKVDSTLYWVIRLYDSGFELVDADSNPTVAVRKNGASTADSVTVTKRTATTGIYDCSYNPAAEAEGDQFTIEESATISAVVYENDWDVVIIAAERGTDSVDTSGLATSAEVAAVLVDTGTTIPGLIAGLNDPTAASIADAVWIETISDHSGTVGSTAEALNAAGGSGDPWTTTLPGSYTGSQAGKILADVLVDTGTTIPAQITGLNDFDPASDTVANVTLVGTVTTNTDMRGTDSALLASSAPTNWSDLSVEAGTGKVTTTSTSDATSANQAAILGHLTDIKGLGWVSSENLHEITVDVTGIDGDSVPTASEVAAAVDVALINQGDGADLISAIADAIASDWVAGDSSPLAIVAALKADAEWSDLSSIATEVSSSLSYSIANATQLTEIKGAGWVADENLNSMNTAIEAIQADTGTDIPAQISSLNDFDPASDTVANVTLVGTVTTNTDMRGTDNALLASSAPTNWSDLLVEAVTGKVTTSNPAAGSGSAHTAEDVRDLILAGDKAPIAVTTGSVDNVTLVDTVTTNTDMRGTDGANTTTPPTLLQVTDAILGGTQDPIVTDGSGRVTIASSSDATSANQAAILSHLTDIKGLGWVSSENLHEITADVTGIDGDSVPTASEVAAAVDVALINQGDGADLISAIADAIASDWVAGDSSPLAIVAALKADAEWSDLSTIATEVSSSLSYSIANATQLTEIKGAGWTAADNLGAIWQQGTDAAAQITAVKSTTDQFAFTVANQVDANALTGGGAGGATDLTPVLDELSDIKGSGWVTGTDSLHGISGSITTGGTTGVNSITVRTEDGEGNAVLGAKVALDGVAYSSQSVLGETSFNLDDGSYTFAVIPPSGYDTPVDQVVAISSDQTVTFVLVEQLDVVASPPNPEPCYVAINVLNQYGGGLEGAIVRVKVTGKLDEFVIANLCTTNYSTDAAGQVVIPMIPKSQFVEGGTYTIEVQFGASSQSMTYDVPDSAVATLTFTA